MKLTTLGQIGKPNAWVSPLSIHDTSRKSRKSSILTINQAVAKKLEDITSVDNFSTGYMFPTPRQPYVVLYPSVTKVYNYDTKLNTYETHTFKVYVYADTYNTLKTVLEEIEDDFDQTELTIEPIYYVPLSTFFEKGSIKQIEEGFWQGNATIIVDSYRKGSLTYLNILSTGTDLFDAVYDRYSKFMNTDLCGERLISQTSIIPYITIENVNYKDSIRDTMGNILETSFDFSIISDHLLDLYFLYLKFTRILDFGKLVFNGVHTYLLREQDDLIQLEEGYWKYVITYNLGNYEVY